MASNSLPSGSRVVCAVRQDEFKPATFTYNAPKLRESQKTCHFINTSWEVRAVCEFTLGHPATHSDCQLLVANSTVRLQLQLQQETVHSGELELLRDSYSVELPGPDASHTGGRIQCRVSQGSAFAARTFAFSIAEYRPPSTPKPELRLSEHTILTLSLALLVALLLMLLMSLPVQALRRCCLNRSKLARKNELDSAIGGPADQAVTRESNNCSDLPHAAAGRPLMERKLAQHTPDQFASPTLTRGGRGARGYQAHPRDCMPDIDQCSMFEWCSYRQQQQQQPKDEEALKRLSVLAAALFRSQKARSRAEYRLSM